MKTTDYRKMCIAGEKYLINTFACVRLFHEEDYSDADCERGEIRPWDIKQRNLCRL